LSAWLRRNASAAPLSFDSPVVRQVSMDVVVGRRLEAKVDARRRARPAIVSRADQNCLDLIDAMS
jgi:hypothetical protein